MDDAETEDMNEATFEGSLDGAEGDFTCTVDPCTLSRVADVDGDATWALVGGWSFEADADETIEVPDADYLAFGYWNMIDHRVFGRRRALLLWVDALRRQRAGAERHRHL